MIKKILAFFSFESNLRFWYAYSFFESGANNEQIHASVYMGYKTPGVTLARIAEAKENAGVDSDAVLLSVSHLGCMTTEDIQYAPA